MFYNDVFKKTKLLPDGASSIKVHNIVNDKFVIRYKVEHCSGFTCYGQIFLADDCRIWKDGKINIKIKKIY